jgi:hypothetical protein
MKLERSVLSGDGYIPISTQVTLHLNGDLPWSSNHETDALIADPDKQP